MAFAGVRLTRADLEWLLATHESQGIRGPVNVDDEAHSERFGVNVSGADFRPSGADGEGIGTNDYATWNRRLILIGSGDMAGVTDLRGLPLARCLFAFCHLEGVLLDDADLREAAFANAHMTGVWLQRSRMEGAVLQNAHLEGALLQDTHLARATLVRAHLDKAHLLGTDLTEADLSEAKLRGAEAIGTRINFANLSDAQFDEESLLGFQALKPGRAVIGQLPIIKDVRWRNANLSRFWSLSRGQAVLGDELAARRWKDDEGRLKTPKQRAVAYGDAAAASLQLSTDLRQQGLAKAADFYGYRAKVLARREQVWWVLEAAWDPRLTSRLRREGSKQRKRRSPLYFVILPLLIPGVLLEILFLTGPSLLLDLTSGYGYKPLRSFLTYLAVVLGFADAYHALGSNVAPALTPVDALIFSLTSFHGRGFSPGAAVTLHNPLTIVAAIEAILGLLIEITFIATFTQRFFAR